MTLCIFVSHHPSPYMMNVHKHSLHEPRTKSPSRRYKKGDPVEERRGTEDPVSYTIQSQEMMNMPASLSSSRSRFLTTILHHVYWSWSPLFNHHLHQSDHGSFADPIVSKSSALAHLIPFSTRWTTSYRNNNRALLEADLFAFPRYNGDFKAIKDWSTPLPTFSIFL